MPKTPEKKYYVVYDRTGRQCGHVSIDDIEVERRAHPDLRYEPSKVVERYFARLRKEA
jgi:hypothetical protein